MLDPLSALSVAGTVVQFLDFTANVIGATVEVYHSSTGVLERHIEVEVVTQDLKDLIARLVRTDRQPDHVPTHSEKQMYAIAQRCERVAQTLLNDLQKLKIANNCRFKSWEALRIALRSLGQRQKAELEALQKSMDRMRSQVMLHLLAILQDKQCAITTSVNRVAQDTNSMRSELAQEFSNAKRDLAALLQSLSDDLAWAKTQKFKRKIHTQSITLADKLQAMKLERKMLAAFQRILVLEGVDARSAEVVATKLETLRTKSDSVEHLTATVVHSASLKGENNANLVKAMNTWSVQRCLSVLLLDPLSTLLRLNRGLQHSSPYDTSDNDGAMEQLKRVVPSMLAALKNIDQLFLLLEDFPLFPKRLAKADLSVKDKNDPSLNGIKKAPEAPKPAWNLAIREKETKNIWETEETAFKQDKAQVSAMREELQSRLEIFDTPAFEKLNYGFWSSVHELQATQESAARVTASNFELLFEKLDGVCRAATVASKSEAILTSLRFREMPFRHIQIPDAYDDTNTWILSSDQSPFRSWLTHSNGIFWINGKAGSGKSTMMKFLADNLLTQKILETWAGVSETDVDASPQSHLVTASHYFWKAGYPMQQSLRGLLQSLLFHILRQCPNLIPVACSSRWNDANEFNIGSKSWTQQDLITALDSLLAAQRWSSWFCFFIDGLDEYSGIPDEQYNMVQCLERLAAYPQVKICVSSRPWNVFREAYSADSTRTLVLQDHNKADLDTYIAGKLESDKRFRRLVTEDQEAKCLAKEIRARAKGVFLWVFLVVRSLLDGITEDDDISQLQLRLRLLPPDLETYFQHMLQSIDPFYKCYTARALLLACGSLEPLPVLSYFYLTQEMKDPQYATKCAIQPMTKSQHKQKRKVVISWVNKWCRDLLEIVKHSGDGLAGATAKPTYRVEFLHRTVRDFLHGGDNQQLFEQDAGTDFWPHVSLCRSYLAQAKMNLDPECHQEFFLYAGFVMAHAKRCEIVQRAVPWKVLQELDRVGAQVAQVFTADHWTYACPRFDSLNEGLRESNFLSYAVEFDLQLFVRGMLQKEPGAVHKTVGAALLDYALRPTIRHPVFTTAQEPLYDMVTLLVNMGAVVDDDFLDALNSVPSDDVGFSTAQSIAIESKNSQAAQTYRREPVSSMTAILKGDYDSESSYREFLALRESYRVLGTSTPRTSFIDLAAQGGYEKPGAWRCRAARSRQPRPSRARSGCEVRELSHVIGNRDADDHDEDFIFEV